MVVAFMFFARYVDGLKITNHGEKHGKKYLSFNIALSDGNNPGFGVWKL